MKKIISFALIAILAAGFVFAAENISRQEAMRIALSDAGISEKDASFVRSHLDWEDGRDVYDVEFYVNENEYDYEIDAVTGEILSMDRDAEYWAPGRNEVVLTEQDAVDIALKDAGLKDVSGYRCYLDRDDGRFRYEVNFASDSRNYEYTIDAENGRILDVDIERVRKVSAEDIGQERAIEIVLERVKGASADDVRIKSDWDDGRIVYEGGVYYGKYEYEFEIDGRNGRVIDWERDRIGR